MERQAMYKEIWLMIVESSRDDVRRGKILASDLAIVWAADRIKELEENWQRWEKQKMELINNPNELHTTTIERDNRPSIRFVGRLLGGVSSSDDRAYGSMYSGSAGRWEEMRVWETESGKFVCQTIRRTRWDGERNEYTAEVCTTHDEVKSFFGFGWLAKCLYEDAGIDSFEELE